jgi:hypothetical protein
MSHTGQASFTSTVQSIIDALANYTKLTGIDLSKNSFATAVERSLFLKLSSPRTGEVGNIGMEIRDSD